MEINSKYFAKAYIPEVIAQGKRNSTISTLIHQLKALNPHLKEKELYAIINMLNTRCTTPLPAAEIEGIKRKLKAKLKEGDLAPILNYPRQIIFSGNVGKKERQSLGGKVSGRNKKRITLKKFRTAWMTGTYKTEK